ncbi:MULTISPECIES: efflux RND transporter periplasmic adaptor subunit [Burkholderia]|uniref:Secretion protein HlyD family protein n=1 Tax=Burkholderia paludis TaxID=1506587 RepID=A0A6P2QXI5_9BURK|nr:MULTISPECIES: HlyD family secretion protein [Burkholderia]CAB3773501.1 p-hydroxybenzoic acid efflux pump subunit AaeA [Burkholderia paludis]VWC28699.1 secretion protein HlyD family protein [Burkholderia paludis]
MKRAISIFVTLLLIGITAYGVIYIWNRYMYTPWTRDGRIRATVVSVAPDVSGWIQSLNAENAQSVKEGDVLFTVDGARYQIALDQAKAQADLAETDWEKAQRVYQRRKTLTDGGVSAEEIDVARLDMENKAAALKQARARVNEAQLDRDRTIYRSPVNGKVINLNLEKGDYVTRGSERLAIIKDNSYYVTGYFEETKIPAIRLGDKVDIWLMAGAGHLTGHVQSINSGISNENTTPGNEQLPSVAATFAWIRFAQRIPVDIVIDKVPADLTLSSGMSATLKVNIPESRKALLRDAENSWKTDFGAVVH